MVEEEGPIFMINENARLSGRRALLTLLTEFLLHYTHQVVFVNGGLPSTVFANAHFQGTIVKRCKLPHIVDYIEKLRCSLAHWIAHEKLAQFVLVLFAEEDERMTKVAEFQVRIKNSNI